MCQTLEIKAKRELLKNEPPRKIKERCVVQNWPNQDFEKKKRKKKRKKQKEEEHIVPGFCASSQAKNRRLLPTNSCSADISAHDSTASSRLMTCKLMCSNCERMQPRSHPVETMRSGTGFIYPWELALLGFRCGRGGWFFGFFCLFPRCSSNSQCVPQDVPNSISIMRPGTDFIPLDFSLLGFGWRDGVIFGFFWGVCSQDVLQVPNVFLKMFPIA
jgi:hypothetical protein